MRRQLSMLAGLLLVPLALAKEAQITSHKNGQIVPVGHLSVDGKFGTPHGEVKAVDITKPERPQVIKDRYDVPALNISCEIGRGQIVKVSARNIPKGVWNEVTLKGAVLPEVVLPKEISIQAGETLRLSAKVTGDYESVIWSLTRGGGELGRGTTLSVPSVAFVDGDTIQCVARGYGRSGSGKCKLHIRPQFKPVSFSSAPAPTQVVGEGEAFKAQVAVAGDILDVRWFNPAGAQVSSATTLVIGNVGEADQGTYKVVVRGKAGNQISALFQLVVARYLQDSDAFLDLPDTVPAGSSFQPVLHLPSDLAPNGKQLRLYELDPVQLHINFDADVAELGNYVAPESFFEAAPPGIVLLQTLEEQDLTVDGAVFTAVSPAEGTHYYAGVAVYPDGTVVASDVYTVHVEPVDDSGNRDDSSQTKVIEHSDDGNDWFPVGISGGEVQEGSAISTVFTEAKYSRVRPLAAILQSAGLQELRSADPVPQGYYFFEDKQRHVQYLYVAHPFTFDQYIKLPTTEGIVRKWGMGWYPAPLWSEEDWSAITNLVIKVEGPLKDRDSVYVGVIQLPTSPADEPNGKWFNLIDGSAPFYEFGRRGFNNGVGFHKNWLTDKRIFDIIVAGADALLQYWAGGAAWITNSPNHAGILSDLQSVQTNLISILMDPSSEKTKSEDFLELFHEKDLRIVVNDSTGMVPRGCILSRKSPVKLVEGPLPGFPRINRHELLVDDVPVSRHSRLTFRWTGKARAGEVTVVDLQTGKTVYQKIQRRAELPLVRFLPGSYLLSLRNISKYSDPVLQVRLVVAP